MTSGKEWLEASSTKKTQDYHLRQFKEPYQSTLLFVEWLQHLNVLGQEMTSHIIDIGCGMGANTVHMAKTFEKSKFTGLDINKEFIDLGNEYIHDHNIENCGLKEFDFFTGDKSSLQQIEGAVSYQTLSWLPSFEESMNAFLEFNPNWIAATSLFYDGPVEAKVEVKDYSIPFAGQDHRQSFYNVYSLNKCEEYFQDKGFSTFLFKKFEIKTPLNKPADRAMGTHTKALEDGTLLQLSGPLMLSWYFIFASK